MKLQPVFRHGHPPAELCSSAFMRDALCRIRKRSSHKDGLLLPLPISRAVALVGAILLQGTGASAATQFASAYTWHDFQACTAQMSSHPDVVDVRQCRGLASVPIVWTNEPDVSWIAFGKDVANRRIPGLDTFYAVRGTIEWRGPPTATGISPIAAVVRYDTGPSIRLGGSRLVIYRLSPRGNCVMGVVDGASATANAAARARVDRLAANFVCGRSKVIVELRRPIAQE